MKNLVIVTPCMDIYKIDGRGRINGSENWLLKGIEHVRRREFIPLEQITPEKIEQLNFLFKTTKNPQYTVRDLDHGTTRVWGNTRYHGIKYMYFENN